MGARSALTRCRQDTNVRILSVACLRQSLSLFVFATTLVTIAITTKEVNGHPLTFTDVTLIIQADGSFDVDLLYDLDALALGAPIDTDDSALVAALGQLTPAELDNHINRLKRLFERRIRVRFDGQPAPFEVTFPDHGTPKATEAAIPTVLGLTAHLEGTIPAGANTVEFFASRAFANVQLTIMDLPRDVETHLVLERGARSAPYDLMAATTPTTATTMYVWLGISHIIPQGLDHILFVLGLFLLSPKLRPLIWQVTAFTIAHACTLTAATFGTISVDANIVEPLIAASIVYVAVENTIIERLTPWRTVIIFCFGLLHGLGFANALNMVGLPNQERLVALLAFNAGIEFGQIAVIAIAAGCIGWFKNYDWYRTRIVVPASIFIALIGLAWFVERTL